MNHIAGWNKRLNFTRRADAMPCGGSLKAEKRVCFAPARICSSATDPFPAKVSF